MACVLFLGCGGSSSEAPGDNFVFSGGEFQLYVKQVSDGCLDGGLDLLFMPSGLQSPYALSKRTWIPAFEDLPQSYEIELKAPFNNMPITMQAMGATGMEVVDAVQSQVELGLPGGACSADMSFSATLTVTSETTIVMETTVVLSNFQSEGELCPNLVSDPCEVGLSMDGVL